MLEQSNEKISQYFDNELAGDEALKLHKQFGSQPELEQKIRRYHMVSQVIRNDSPVLADNNFVQKVNQALDEEVTHFLPKKRQSMRTLMSGVALAASVATVAVIINQQTEQPPRNQEFMLVAKNHPKAVENRPVSNKIQPVNPRFNQYLHAHRGGLYFADPTAQPYAKLAGYGK